MAIFPDTTGISINQNGTPIQTSGLYGVDTSKSGSKVTNSLPSFGSDEFISWMQKFGKNDEAIKDKYLDFLMSEYSNEAAFKRSMKDRDTAYDSLMSQLKRNGISPYILSGSLPSASSSQATSYTGSQLVSQQSNKVTSQTSSLNNNATVTANLLRGFLTSIGIVAAAIIGAVI